MSSARTSLQRCQPDFKNSQSKGRCISWVGLGTTKYMGPINFGWDFEIKEIYEWQYLRNVSFKIFKIFKMYCAVQIKFLEILPNNIYKVWLSQCQVKGWFERLWIPSAKGFFADSIWVIKWHIFCDKKTINCKSNLMPNTWSRRHREI